MKFSSAFAALAAASLTSAEWVACRVDGVQISVVSKETGECPFPINKKLPVNFTYRGPTDYLVNAYYIKACGQNYYNEPIHQAGRVIQVPARCLFDKPTDIFHIHLAESPSNTTDGLRKRFDSQFYKRDVAGGVAGLIDLVKRTVGTRVLNQQVVNVNAPDPGTYPTYASQPSDAKDNKTLTVTSITTSLVTVTSCDSSMCDTTVIPKTPREVTETVQGTVTRYVKWYPMDFSPQNETVTITYCELDTCYEKVTTCVVPICTTTVTICQDETCYPVPVPTTRASAAAAAASAAASNAAAANVAQYAAASAGANVAQYAAASAGANVAPYAAASVGANVAGASVGANVAGASAGANVAPYAAASAAPNAAAANAAPNAAAANAAPNAAAASASGKASSSAAASASGNAAAAKAAPNAASEPAMASVYKGAGAVAKGSVLAMLALPLAYIL
ncbi:hypothetical protein METBISCDRAFT_24482 [Metschnikowia bicuspidata]|uniref:Uncharacterized protein n=1 Tax=Metschnikowia bicuspidata TaxID=27322 RepID=A0A4P9Z8X5_9ASCO|nr:hypothetical protein METBISCDRAFT_24482 [Metschnikowia bicuspidata]